MKPWLENRRQSKLASEREDQIKFQLKLKETKDSTVKSADEMPEKILTDIKLPKITIAEFEGSPMDWPRFWSQFQETIDKRPIAAINKFTYLCGLLGTKVKHNVEALPFTTEGYNRAKAILVDRYGKDAEVVKAYVKEIMDLPLIPNANAKKIHDFSDRLTRAVQALQTLNKLSSVNGYAPMTLDKLPGIRGDLTRTDPEWEKWDFAKLAEALTLWTRRNPVTDTREAEQKKESPRKLMNTRERERGAIKECVYCSGDHKSTNCTVTKVAERKEILKEKRLCYNCTAGNHRASLCPSKSSCRICHKRHHTSICDNTSASPSSEQRSLTAMTAAVNHVNSEGIFPYVVIDVNGIRCRALIDSGAGSSYISAKLVQMLTLKPAESKIKRVDMLMESKTTRLETYNITIHGIDSEFKMEAKVTKVEKSELLNIDNPQYAQLKGRFKHLREAKFIDVDSKPLLPIHVVLGCGEYARIKTEERPLIGAEAEPVAEKTKLGWIMMSPGAELDSSTMLLTQTSQRDYEDLCRLDVLGLADSAEYDQAMVHSEFKEQLQRSSDGWYETGLPWRGDHNQLLNNREGSLRRLKSLRNRLSRKNLLDAYDGVIQEQLEEGVVEVAPEQPKGTEFYIPHKEVVRDSAESTKLRVVYDASARPSYTEPSLNEFLHAGPPLQNKLWEVLVRVRSFPVALTGDIKKAFLQIRIREAEIDALRFHWQKSDTSPLLTLRFTRALFGLVSSPFLLGGVIEAHLDHWEKKAPEAVAALRKSLYVDDILTGGETVHKAEQRKAEAEQILGDAKFTLHKWSSNAPMKICDNSSDIEEQTAAKQHLGVEPTESILLGLSWNKDLDTLSVVTEPKPESVTKRSMLRRLAKIYDPLGIASPLLLTGKQMYREVCDQKLPWDADISGGIRKRWEKWEESLPKQVSIPRAVAPLQEEVEKIEIHGFGDASTEGLCAAVYTVTRQPSGVSQELLASKSRLAKRDLTIPRLELIAGHMAVNLVENASRALSEVPLEKHCWLDSTVALWWIKGEGDYKQFVANRVAKIQAAKDITWHYVPTEDNPADLGSRGGQLSTKWLKGPSWLQERTLWPPNPVINPSKETQAEAKITRVVLAAAAQEAQTSTHFKLLEKFTLKKALRVSAWVKRFLHNARTPAEKQSGPLTTEEMEQQYTWWINQVQKEAIKNPRFENDKTMLNLQPNAEDILECQGRIQGKYPIYLPDDALFTRRLVEQAHLQTLHGGVGLIMAKIREKYWVPRLRTLAKKVRRECYHCKRFLSKSYQAPMSGPLPKTRTEPATPFQNIGIDFAGPIRYRITKTREGKAYLVLYSCSLTKGVYLEVLGDTKSQEIDS